MTDADLAIGEIAQACRINVSAVRYYSDVLLLPVTRSLPRRRDWPCWAR